MPLGTLLLIVVVAGTSAVAQPRILTLDEARNSALAYNLSVVQAENNVESAQASAMAARGDYLPSISASGGWRRVQNDRPGSSPILLPDGSVIPGTTGFAVTNNFSAGVDLSYTIFDGFRREGTLRSATSGAVASEHNAVRTRQAIVFETERGYLNVLRLGQLVKVSEENLKRGERQLERIVESNRVGALSLADVYRQQSQVASDELAVITAQNNADKAEADLLAFIGLDLSAEYVFADRSTARDVTKEELDSILNHYRDFDGLSRRALAARPDYESVKENLEASEARVTSARSSYFPSVTASGGYGLNNSVFSRLNENKSLTWGLTFQWTLFDGFQTNQNLQSAITSMKNANVSLLQVERDIKVEVQKAILDLEAARKAYDVSQKGLISATQDRKIAEERYNLGAGTLLDLLTANAGLVDAEANKINAYYSYTIARRNLEFVLGEKTY